METYQPHIILENLFKDVALAGIIEDDKWWSDAIPKYPIGNLVKKYNLVKNEANFDLLTFVNENFFVNEGTQKEEYKTSKAHSLDEHIHTLWKVLAREDNELHLETSSILLPHPYIIPGGRFKEIYYWDSYFTMLGLREHGEWDMIASMVKNFAWLIDTFGFVPNGSRTYYLTRSQPPFFSLMVAILASKEGVQVYSEYLDTLVKEHEFWTIADPARIVTLSDGNKFSRYYDTSNEPRTEMYATDVGLKKDLPYNPSLLREIRSACESGWDFSSRWFDESRSLASIRTSKLIPIDLECLLWHLESSIATAYKNEGNHGLFQKYQLLAENRKNRIHQYFWNDEKGFYCDFDIEKNGPSSVLSLAGLYPLFFELVHPEFANIALKNVEKYFLQSGGLVTTIEETGQQWDSPNGWAPLQWIGFKAALNYGHHDLAKEIANRWTQLNEKIFYETGKMLEKYDVIDTNAEGGGGEYPVQDGFGWTNGVYLALKAYL